MQHWLYFERVRIRTYPWHTEVNLPSVFVVFRWGPVEDELACIKKHLDQQSISLVPMPQVIFLEFKKQVSAIETSLPNRPVWLFHVGHVAWNGQSVLSLDWNEWLSCKGREWKIYWFGNSNACCRSSTIIFPPSTNLIIQCGVAAAVFAICLCQSSKWTPRPFLANQHGIIARQLTSRKSRRFFNSLLKPNRNLCEH